VRAPKVLLAPATSLLIAAAIAGCGPFGDDGDDGGAGEGAVSEREFVQRGDEICASAQDQFAELRREPPTNPAQSARFTQELIGISEEEVAQLEDLEAPEERQDVFERYLRAREQAIGFLHEGLEAARSEDATAYAQAQANVAKGQVERAELAQRVGFKECSGPLGGGAPPV
jgi:hypothetical protein